MTARQPEMLGHPLYPYHRRVLALIADGLTDAQIGEHLGISRHTVVSYTIEVYSRLGARTRAHAVSLAYQAGILTVQQARPLEAAS